MPVESMSMVAMYATGSRLASYVSHLPQTKEQENISTSPLRTQYIHQATLRQRRWETLRHAMQEALFKSMIKGGHKCYTR